MQRFLDSLTGPLHGLQIHRGTHGPLCGSGAWIPRALGDPAGDARAAIWSLQRGMSERASYVMMAAAGGPSAPELPSYARVDALVETAAIAGRHIRDARWGADEIREAAEQITEPVMGTLRPFGAWAPAVVRFFRQGPRGSIRSVLSGDGRTDPAPDYPGLFRDQPLALPIHYFTVAAMLEAGGPTSLGPQGQELPHAPLRADALEAWADRYHPRLMEDLVAALWILGTEVGAERAASEDAALAVRAALRVLGEFAPEGGGSVLNEHGRRFLGALRLSIVTHGTLAETILSEPAVIGAEALLSQEDLEVLEEQVDIALEDFEPAPGNNPTRPPRTPDGMAPDPNAVPGNGAGRPPTGGGAQRAGIPTWLLFGLASAGILAYANRK